LPLGQDRQRSDKPPEQAVSGSPTHTRSVAPHVRLKQNAESGADNQRKEGMERDAQHYRFRVDQSRDQQEETDLRQRPAADNACKTAKHDGPKKTERYHLHLSLGARLQGTQRPNRQPEWHSKAENVGDKFREMGARGVRHS